MTEGVTRGASGVPGLEGEVALVTGGGTGLGASVCRLLAARGAAVAVNWSRSGREAEALAADLREGGGRALAVRADVRDERAVGEMVGEIERRLGPVGLLVNNSGVTRVVAAEDLEEVTTEDWDLILGVNLLGAWNCVRAVAPRMRAAGAGSIVNVASESAFTFEGSSIPYVVSKGALVTLTRALARTLRPLVRVNAVAPGWMATGWLERYLPQERRAAVLARAKDLVPVEGVAEEIVRLLSDGSSSGLVVVPRRGAADGGGELLWEERR